MTAKWIVEGSAARGIWTHLLMGSGNGWLLRCSGNPGRPVSAGQRLCPLCQGLADAAYLRGDLGLKEGGRWIRPSARKTASLPEPDPAKLQWDADTPLRPRPQVRVTSAAARKCIRQHPASRRADPDGSLVTAETSAAVWTLVHKGYSGNGRLDVWVYPDEETALFEGARLALACGLADDEPRAVTLFDAADYQQVLDLYEQNHPGNLLRAQLAFFGVDDM